MLSTLRIKNLALVEDLALDLEQGYTALTGETGAGKSIILGALNLILGQKADRSLIRSGAETCTVEAVFHFRKLDCGPGAHMRRSDELADKIVVFLNDNGLEPPQNDELFLKRTFSAGGGNKQFINGSPATLNQLQTLGDWLLDMHGPHDHQSLFHPSRQLEILDAFAGSMEIRRNFEKLFQEVNHLEKSKRELISDEKSYAQQLDLLEFQAREIQDARLKEGEDQNLEEQFEKVRNATRIAGLAQSSFEQLSGEENSLLSQAHNISREFHELQRLDPAARFYDEFRNIQETLGELSKRLESYRDQIDVSPERLAEMESRLDFINGLKRKYGATISEIQEFGREAVTKLKRLHDREGELQRLDAEREQKLVQLLAVGRQLTALRHKSAPKLAGKVKRELADLGFLQSDFHVALQTESTSVVGASTGFDSVAFQFSPNPGEPMKSLKAIASSGEMARVMLAIKTVLAREDEVPVLVFDEVDANVGGQTARAVGEKMRQIARQRQVLCITHLAPVAAAADHHFVVSKEIKEARTISVIQKISGHARVEEIARMLGGLSTGARKHAEELLETRN